ncbi:HigA family addiction module antitoxin [Propylenella binzhouense]|uniref:Addiction module antidote protein, HigA family n=1 Tax=Propylenella binzhouense TaxID=2555902 RepID=A0A964T7N0_9HYPH|nr:HigA family addiction module antitoxin [Propylenella binzhouense]MYZ50041.1 addiction module antidote protein, HigA family [Propylenella binzhouense]
MKNPSHPGEILRDALDELGVSVTDAARHLAVNRVTLSRILNGKAGISADLAVRLEEAGISTARLWLAVQANWDLAEARRHEQPPVKRFVPA